MRGATAGAAWHAICSLQGMTNIKRILVPTDFSEPADEALDHALFLAQALGATISLAHVFQDPYAAAFVSEQYVPMPAALREEALDEVRHHLAARVARSGRRDMTTEILSGPAAQAIVERGRDADLIVMGTHGRHGMAHLLMGSVAERVVRLAPCPVLTVRGGADRQTKAA
jgi:nucleotide-binding universal stress UspA family protein